MDVKTRTVALGASIFIGFALVVIGCWLLAPAIGLIAAGVAWMVWSFLAFLEVD